MNSNKSLAGNSIYSVLYRLINISFPFITSVYIARVLQAGSIGRVAAAQNTASYFTLAAALGIPTYGVKLIARYEIGSRESSKAFSELFILSGIFSLLCSAGYFLAVSAIPHFEGQEKLYYIVGLTVIFNFSNIDWFYQGIQEYGYIAVRSLFFKLLSLGCLFIFVKNEEDILAFALIDTLTLVGGYLFNVIHLRKYIRPTFRGLAFKAHLKPILILFLSTVAVEIYVLADITMLDHMCSSSVVGYYTMSARIVRVIRGLAVAVSAVFLPRLSFLYYNGDHEGFLRLVNKGLHIISAITIPVSLGFLFAADDAVRLFFSSAFEDSILAARILSPSIITVAFSNFIGLQVFVTTGKEKITTISTICGAIVNVSLNIFLIPAFQQNGAAAASAVTEFIVMLIQLVFCFRYIHFQLDIRKTCLSVCMMLLTMAAIRLFLPYGIWRLVLSVLAGAAVYISLMIFLKDSFAIGCLEYVRRRKQKGAG